jgi:ABC-2 type transport system ATP-binding protein/lipopolysaccharide transport system ATP-binding protein
MFRADLGDVFLDLDDVSFRYPSRLFSAKNSNSLSSISFRFGDGDKVGLIGSNGAGKSTFLRLAAGIFTATSGSIDTAGTRRAVFSATVGLPVQLTVDQVARYGLRLLKQDDGQLKQKVDEIVRFAELEDYTDRPYQSLSAGMQLRLGFSIVTYKPPDIALFDEVIGVGDARFRDKSAARLANFVEQAKILIVASHSIDVLRRYCDHAIWLQRGRILDFGPLERVHDQYRRYRQLFDS